MSELINTTRGRGYFRRSLLATVSGVALLASVSIAWADDSDGDHPTVWVELGGQLDRRDGDEDRFAPPFVLATPRPGPETVSPLSLERDPRYDTGVEGKVSFQPEGSDWVFSAAVRYGRANGNKHLHQQSYPTFSLYSHIATFAKPTAAQFIDTKVQSTESDAIVDFQVGKDVGLGLFSGKGSSIFGAGIRFAQFSSKSNTILKSDPDWHFHYVYVDSKYPHFPVGQAFHDNAGTANAERSFRGVGPSLTWNASQPVAGNPESLSVSLDWGLNAAILFGRQKASTQHQTTAHFHPSSYLFGKEEYVVYQTSTAHRRSRTVTVPNVGGFAGVTLKFPNAKISLGYRGDFFFGAMDGGIDTAKTGNRGFYGPFAIIGVGLGG